MRALKLIIEFLLVLFFCLVASLHSWGFEFHFTDKGEKPPNAPATYLYLWYVDDPYPPMIPTPLDPGISFEITAALQELTVVNYYNTETSGACLHGAIWNLRKIALEGEN